MSWSRAERLIQLVVDAQLRGALGPYDATELARWIERADLRERGALPPPTTPWAPSYPSPHHPEPPPRLAPLGYRRRSQGRRRKTRAEQRREAHEDQHQREVESWFGERPLLPSERWRLADYEPG